MRVLETSRGVLRVGMMKQTKSRMKRKPEERNLSMHSYIKICLTEWFWMSLVSTAQNQVLQKHLDSRVSMFLGLQLREVEIRCFVACSGKVVSGSHGLSEPWEFWPQRPYLYKILMLNNMCRSWVVKSSWPLKRYRLQIQAFVIGLPIKKIWELIMLKPKN